MARWAVFDVDGTLLPHTSTEQEFFKHLLAQQMLPPANLGMFLLMSAWYTMCRQPHQLKANKMYLRGFPVNATRRYGKRFFRRFLWPRFSRDGIAEVLHRHAAGYRIFILSGAPLFLVEPLRQKLPVDELLASQPEERNGRFTGWLAAPHPYAQQKRDYLLELAAPLEMDFHQSVVFANHHTDALHMELFGEVVAVNPTPRLESEAQQNGWRIVHWH